MTELSPIPYPWLKKHAKIKRIRNRKTVLLQKKQVRKFKNCDSLWRWWKLWKNKQKHVFVCLSLSPSLSKDDKLFLSLSLPLSLFLSISLSLSVSLCLSLSLSLYLYFSLNLSKNDKLNDLLKYSFFLVLVSFYGHVCLHNNA